MPTKTLDPEVEADIPRDYIDKGVKDIENHANQAGGTGGAGRGSGPPGSPQGSGKGSKRGGTEKREGKPSGAQSRGQNAAGKANNAMDNASERLAEQAGRKYGGAVGGKLAKGAMRLRNKLEKKLTGGNEEARLALRLAQPLAPILIPIGIVVFLIVAVLSGTSGADPNADPNAPKLTITKTGPTEAVVDQILDYQIAVTYPGTAQDIVITDNIPAGTEFDPALNPPPAKFDPATRTVTWNLKDTLVPPATILNNVNTTLSLKLKATANNSFLVNQATGTVTGAGTNPGGPVSGDIAKLLPNPIPPDPADSQGLKDAVINAVNQDPKNREAYNLSSSETGLPWQIFAGIHYREGNANPNSSIVSGRGLGGNEPDVVDGPGCASDAPRGVTDGLAEPMAGGCGFSSLADSGIYAGILLKGKTAGEINSFEPFVEALSNYNGGGNANCGKTPYANCPRLFYGEDDTYVMHYFDDKHVPMYIVYCADGTKCATPVQDTRPGTATAIKWVSQGIQ